jgi:hypothetical protein
MAAPDFFGAGIVGINANQINLIQINKLGSTRIGNAAAHN